jgi:hypothetical protein
MAKHRPYSKVACLALSLAVWSARARADVPPAESPLYSIAIGQNEAPATTDTLESPIPALRYADDDALKFHRFMAGRSRRAFLLTVPDRETQTRVPDAARGATPPTLAALDGAVEQVRAAMLADRAAGREPVLVLFFSGHGVMLPTGGAGLALHDGVLTESWLESHVFARLPARAIHVIVDACHAAAAVRVRDLDATLEPVGAEERERYLESSSLARYPNVGTILASSATAQAFEWDVYRGGVFAHELMSGLRGAADVNGDGRIEYSEIAAFFAAANLRVTDARARLEVVVEPPRSDARAPLVARAGNGTDFRLVGKTEGAWSHAFYVESENGSRVVDVFPEQGKPLALWLPAGEQLYLVRGKNEITVKASAGDSLALASLALGPSRARSRGALETSLARGLFGTRFGPAFYLGYTSGQGGLAPVQLPPEVDAEPGQRSETPYGHSSWRRPAGTALLFTSGAAAVTAGIFTGLALGARSDYESARYERPAAEARGRFNRSQIVAWTSAGAAAIFGAAGAGLLFWPGPNDGRKPSVAIAVSPTKSELAVSGGF